MMLVAEPAAGTFTVIISRAAGFDRRDDLAQGALGLLCSAAARGFEGVLESSRWNWWGGGRKADGVFVPDARPEAPFGAVTHIFSRGAKIPYPFWMRYEYTMDRTWLRERAYPMRKGVAEFYRNFPNTKKGFDGQYHIEYVNSNESLRGARQSGGGVDARAAWDGALLDPRDSWFIVKICIQDPEAKKEGLAWLKTETSSVSRSRTSLSRVTS